MSSGDWILYSGHGTLSDRSKPTKKVGHQVSPADALSASPSDPRPFAPVPVMPGAVRLGKVGEIHMISLSAIAPDPTNPPVNFDQEALRRLSETLKNPMQQRLVQVRRDGKDRFVVVAGECYHQSAMAAGHEVVNCLILDGSPDPADVKTDQRLGACFRESLDPIAKALAYEDLMLYFAGSERRLADCLNISRSCVSRYLDLLDLVPMVQELVKIGKLNLTMGAEIAKMDPGKQEEFAKSFIEESKRRRRRNQ